VDVDGRSPNSQGWTQEGPKRRELYPGFVQGQD